MPKRRSRGGVKGELEAVANLYQLLFDEISARLLGCNPLDQSK